jgi:tRNA (guanine-N7-)-methyltransferase
MSPRAPRSSAGRGAEAPLSPEAAKNRLDLNGRDGPLLWGEVFGREAPVELEIGCGNGRFMARMAAQRPERNFLAIEQSRKYACLAAERLAKHDVRNARAACAKAHDFLERWTTPGSLDGVHILFSDPWPKRRHAKRRLFRRPFLDLLARSVAPKAPVQVKTDVDWYFADIVALFIEHGAFGLETYGEQIEFPDEDLQMTGFESKAQRLGRRVFFLEARRRIGHPR